MDNEIIKLLTIIAIPTVTIVGSNIVLFMNLNKKIDGVKDELTNFKIENNDRFAKLEIETKTGFEKLSMRIERLEMKFGVVDDKITNTNQRIDEVKEVQITTTNQRIDKIEAEVKKVEAELKEQRSEFKEMLNKVLDLFNNFNRKDKDVVNQLEIRN